jgi:hypothetical protein
MENHASNGFGTDAMNANNWLSDYDLAAAVPYYKRINDLPLNTTPDVALTEPPPAPPITIEDIRYYVTAATRALLFAPADNSLELAISRPARELLDFFPSPQAKQTMQYLCVHTAEKFFPADNPTYQPRKEFMQQQVMLRRISLLRGGGVFRLPDITLRLAHQGNDGSSHVELQLAAKHLVFGKVFLGTLFLLHHHPLATTTYEKYRDTQQLISPTPTGMTDFLKRFCERYIQQEDLLLSSHAASFPERISIKSEKPEPEYASLWDKLLSDALQDLNSLIAQFLARLEDRADAGDLSALREADKMAVDLRDAVQAHIRRILGIEAQATVGFHTISKRYVNKNNEEKIYTTLKASWREGKKMRSMAAPRDNDSSPQPE